VDIHPDASGVEAWAKARAVPCVVTSAKEGRNIDNLKLAIVDAAPSHLSAPTLVGDLVSPGDTVVLVVPIDKAAPKGRLILPQAMTIRDILDHDANALVVKERELKAVLDGLAKRPRLVVTDSQAFLKVAADTPRDVLMTGFSILMARYRGSLDDFVEGARALRTLRPGKRVLISEGCTHHKQADDIGTVQIPRWLRQAVGGDLVFGHSSGLAFPDDFRSYDLIIHCGACMLNRREVLFRQREAKAAGVPMTNYGIVLAHVHGILGRALEPFPLAHAGWMRREEPPTARKVRLARVSG
jgi:[FeFe] hydrogenase H-cluster maturation GTPase HydF